MVDAKDTTKKKKGSSSFRWTFLHLLLGILLSVLISLFAAVMVLSPVPYSGYVSIDPSSSGFSRKIKPHSGSVDVETLQLLLDDEYASGIPYDIQPQSGDDFQSLEENPYKRTSEEPVSTFSVDVDTSSYSYTRRLLKDWRFPSPDVIKIEEMINYFDYEYPLPQDKGTPFESAIMISDSPWHTGRKLMHIGIKGYNVEPTNRLFSNIVFLVDVSGSMDSPDKLPLAKESIEMLLGTMVPEDYVSIVTYASQMKEALPPTPRSQEEEDLIGSAVTATRRVHMGDRGH